MRKYNVSNTAIVYDSRSGKSARIGQIIKKYDTDGNVLVIDYAITEAGPVPINSKQINFNKQTIDSMFTNIGINIDTTDSFVEKVYEVLDTALYLYNNIDVAYPNYTGGWALKTEKEVQKIIDAL